MSVRVVVLCLVCCFFCLVSLFVLKKKKVFQKKILRARHVPAREITVRGGVKEGAGLAHIKKKKNK